MASLSDESISLPPIFAQYLQNNQIDPSIYTESNYYKFFTINPLIRNKDNILARAQTELGSVTPVCWSPGFYRVDKDAPMSKSPLFISGDLLALDAASGLAVSLLELHKNDHFLDLCCAPGTKLTLSRLLIGSEGIGSVTGVDISKSRLATARSLLKKYRLDRARLFCLDGTLFNIQPHQLFPIGCREKPFNYALKPFHLSSDYRKSPGQLATQVFYDKVLVDAQCTHDGSVKHIRKVMAAGWKNAELDMFAEPSLQALYKLQRELLENGFRLLKPGGILIYCTCSLSAKQNKEIVDWLISRDCTAVLKPFTIQNLGVYNQPMIQLSPKLQNCCGLFIARITKLNNKN